LKDFFQRAVLLRDRQKDGEKSKKVFKVSGVHVFCNGDAIAAKGPFHLPRVEEVKSACPEINGFELVIATLALTLTLTLTLYYALLSSNSL